MTTTMEFDFEVTDRLTFPSNHGRVTVEVETQATELATHRLAFDTAFAMVFGLRGVEMVTLLQLVL
jgi:hypothetical protein